MWYVWFGVLVWLMLLWEMVELFNYEGIYVGVCVEFCMKIGLFWLCWVVEYCDFEEGK